MIHLIYRFNSDPIMRCHSYFESYQDLIRFLIRTNNWHFTILDIRPELEQLILPFDYEHTT